MFLNLKILKIHLEHQNAIDFLRNFGLDFCDQIEELSVDTNTVPDGQEQPFENDMGHILAKFNSLKTLHLSPVFFPNFDAKYLLLESQNLLEIKILRKQGAAQQES